jgi:hypothetical protein
MRPNKLVAVAPADDPPGDDGHDGRDPIDTSNCRAAYYAVVEDIEALRRELARVEPLRARLAELERLRTALARLAGIEDDTGEAAREMRLTRAQRAEAFLRSRGRPARTSVIVAALAAGEAVAPARMRHYCNSTTTAMDRSPRLVRIGRGIWWLAGIEPPTGDDRDG